jgi:hypothetical protein
LIANLCLADIGPPDWMDRIEHRKIQLKGSMLTAVRKNMAASRLQLEGLAQNQLTQLNKGFFAVIKRGAVSRNALA